MKYGMVFLALCLLTLVAGSTGRAQDLQGTLEKLSEDAAKSYVNPIVSGFGSDLNGGWFHRAPQATKLGFTLEFGVVAMGTFFKDENKVFSSSGSFQFDSSQSQTLANSIVNNPGNNPLINAIRDSIRNQVFTVGISGPTIIGSKSDSLRVTFYGRTFTTFAGSDSVPTQAIVLPITGLIENLSVLPLAAPQLTLGTVFGTQVSFRYLPQVQITKEIGSFKYFGFGIQHNPAVWLGDSPLPVDVSLGYFTQTLDVGSIFTTKSTSFGIQASKQLGWSYLNLTPYLGFQSESSTMTFTYDYTINTLTGPQVQHITFDLKGANSARFTAGMALRLGIFNLNADYNFASYNSATAGFMISF
jgi:hypothetical protein